MAFDACENYNYVDPSSLPNISLSDVLNEFKEGFYTEQYSDARLFYRRGPVFHDDPLHANVFQSLCNCIVRYPSVGIISAKDVNMVGYRTYLTSAGCFFNDEVFCEKQELVKYLEKINDQDNFRNEMSGLSSCDGKRFNLSINHRELLICEDPVIVLCSDEPYNHGSFLFRVLPKLACSALIESNIKIMLPSKAESYFALFDCLGLKKERIIQHDENKIYKFHHAIIPTLRNPQAFLDEASLGLFSILKKGLRRIDESKMVYVSREDLKSTASGYRQMLEGKTLLDELEKRGFYICYPEKMSITDQVELFASAKIVVGQAGAGMFNVVFSNPGTHVIDIESEPHWIHAHMCLFSSLNLQYSIIEGKANQSSGRSVHMPFNIDVYALLTRIDEILKRIWP